VATPFGHAEREPVRCGQLGEERRALGLLGAELEVRIARPGDRAGGEQRAPQVRGTAARAGDNASRRAFQRLEPRAEDPGLVQRLDGARVVLEVDLEARRPVEGAAAVRPDLARDAVAAQKADSTARDRSVPDLEVDADPPAAAEVDGARRADERRELGEPAVRRARLDRRQLGADVLGQSHSAPSSSSRRRL
jgi:hypothetical protein